MKPYRSTTRPSESSDVRKQHVNRNKRMLSLPYRLQWKAPSHITQDREIALRLQRLEQAAMPPKDHPDKATQDSVKLELRVNGLPEEDGEHPDSLKDRVTSFLSGSLHLPQSSLDVSSVARIGHISFSSLVLPFLFWKHNNSSEISWYWQAQGCAAVVVFPEEEGEDERGEGDM